MVTPPDSRAAAIRGEARAAPGEQAVAAHGGHSVQLDTTNLGLGLPARHFHQFIRSFPSCSTYTVSMSLTSRLFLTAARLSPLRRLKHSARASSSQCFTRLDHPHFPCVDAHAVRESRLKASIAQSSPVAPDTGPEPSYARPNPATYSVYHHPHQFPLTYSTSSLPSFDIAYETWGTLSPSKDNVILLHTGLSASSHAASTEANPAPGWWEKFIGPWKGLGYETILYYMHQCPRRMLRLHWSFLY
jgi:hypothetical protein